VTYDIESEFSDLDAYYPGSRRKRREAPVVAADEAWDEKPLVKWMDGREVEFYLLGSLAKALGKSPVTIRLWERKQYIPKSPYRLPSHINKQGKEIPGKRVFTRELIQIAVEEFAKRGLLGAARVEWKQHDDLTIALYERWSTAINT
jgi:hypothetical protein